MQGPPVAAQPGGETIFSPRVRPALRGARALSSGSRVRTAVTRGAPPSWTAAACRPIGTRSDPANPAPYRLVSFGGRCSVLARGARISGSASTGTASGSRWTGRTLPAMPGSASRGPSRSRPMPILWWGRPPAEVAMRSMSRSMPWARRRGTPARGGASTVVAQVGQLDERGKRMLRSASPEACERRAPWNGGAVGRSPGGRS